MGVSERTRSVTLQELMSPWLLSLRAPLTAKGCAVEDAPQAPDFIKDVLLLAEPYVMQEHSSRGTTGIYSVCRTAALCARSLPVLVCSTGQLILDIFASNTKARE